MSPGCRHHGAIQRAAAARSRPRPLGLSRGSRPPLAAQRGFGLAKFLLAVVLVAFFVNLGIKMLPSYLTFFQVRTVMERVASRPELLGAGPRPVLEAILRQLSIDKARTVGGEDFDVERDGGETRLRVAYEVQRPIGLNVDVLMRFQHSVSLTPP